MRSILRALAGIVTVAGACAVIKLYTCHIYAVCCMCECVCKKKNTIFSGLYCFTVHCAKLEKNNNSDNKLDLVIRNASIVILVCW